MTDYSTMIEALRDEAALGKAGDGYRMISAEALNAVAYAIEELQNNVKDLQSEIDMDNDILRELDNARPRWISVEERLPEKSGHYLAVMNGKTGEAYYGHESHIWLDPCEEWENWTRFVTHWMPLPQPPKEET